MSGMERLGPFTYRQGGFPLGQDTLLLGRFATLRRGGRVCDLGCGAGALPLLLLARESSLDLSGVELDGEAAALARRNLAENGLSGVIRTGDLRRVREQFPAGCFDLVVSNPPYFPAGSGESGGSARMELCCTLTQVCAAAAFLLKNGGRFALVHRPERLAGLMEALGQSGLEPKRLQMVQHDRDKPPAAVLVEAVRQGRPGLSVLPTLILNER
ncbi:methyltransferase [Lawsonibacter sp. NSJ-51]|uniref:Methyltransferase n=2 Tax=Lawsonibacter hominis TaxID=2763053 RepID=A0A8J6JE24_9FIRM|nr:methyltransferase [Lawsonibacter hominis]